jgi:hypothetical protein
MDEASSWNYEDWAELIFLNFFSEENGGEDILFAIDDPVLAEISALSEEGGATSLAGAVKSRVSGQWRLASISNTTRVWKRQGGTGAHPALPVLALTVLAASRMAADGNYAAHNYYVPLRRLLDPHDSGGGAPGDFPTEILGLWASVREWSEVDLEGRYGILKADMTGGHFPYIAPALQHAFLRNSDLHRLDAFFRVLGLEPASEPPVGSELRRALKSWTSNKDETWARRLHEACLDDPVNELHKHCERLLTREARRWDGMPRDAQTGHAIGRLRLAIKNRRNSGVQLFSQWDERIGDEVELVVPGYGPRLLRREEDSEWFEPNPLGEFSPPLIDDWLSNGVEFAGDPTKFELPGAAAHVLRYDESMANHVSVDYIIIGVPHLVLTHRRHVDTVTNFLTALAEDSEIAREPVTVSDDPRLADWTLIGPFKIDSRPTTRPPEVLAQYLPTGTGLSLRLIGGLHVGPGQRTYLRGGEPAVGRNELIEDSPRLYRVGPDGEEVEVPIGSEGEEVPLWEERLEPGSYKIRQGPATVALEIVDGIAEEAGPGAGSVRLGGNIEGTIAHNADAVAQPWMVEAPRGAQQSFLLGAGGPTEYDSVCQPRWFSHALKQAEGGGSLDWRQIEAWTSFEPVWQVLQSRSGGQGKLHLLEERPPIALEPFAADTDWSKALCETPLVEDASEAAAILLQAYKEAIEGNCDA